MGSSKSTTVKRIALFTGGLDKHYAFGLSTALLQRGFEIDFIGSDELSTPEILALHKLNFLNLRGSQDTNVNIVEKVLRIIRYYIAILGYTIRSRPKIFHILWDNKFKFLDRILLLLYYKAWRKKVVFTAHNINMGKRDGTDTFYNRATLWIQYSLCNLIFVHTDKMKQELMSEFGVSEGRIAVIPFGINNGLPRTSITELDARKRLGIEPGERFVITFGQIAPYKGIDILVDALARIDEPERPTLIIAGKPKQGEEDYWTRVCSMIKANGLEKFIKLHAHYIPDEDVEIYFKGADAIILPYKSIYQSGIPFVAYSFGVPVIATDVGSFREEIVEGKTGYLCKGNDPDDIAKTIKTYFESQLYASLELKRQEIIEYVGRENSWDRVAQITENAYGLM